MSHDPIRIGVIGAGGNTRKLHIPGFQAIDGVDVVVVCNRSEASSRRAADEFGISRIAAAWQEVVADPEVDAICIGTWPYLHAEVSIAALDAERPHWQREWWLPVKADAERPRPAVADVREREGEAAAATAARADRAAARR